MVNHVEKAIKQLGPTLKAIRKEKGYSREKFAERIGITPRHLTAIENEERKPSCETFYAIIHSLGVSADRFLFSDNQNSDIAEEIKNLYLQCSERDKKIIYDIINMMLENQE